MMTEQIVADKRSKIHAMVDELLNVVDAAVEDHTPLHEVEKDLLPRVLRVGGEAVGLLLDKLGHGNVGHECPLPDGRTLKRSAELKAREYQSVFGTFTLQRYVYAQREGQKAELIPLDARLALPESKFSYLLQDFDQHLAMEQPFEQVSSTIERILGIGQHVDSLERTNHKMAEHVEDFHMHEKAPPADEEGTILVETADGKGVPIRRASDAPRIEDHQRRCGPKPDRKKMATVASVYSVDPHPRTAQQVVASLFRSPREKRADAPQRPRPCHKRVRACLNYTDSEGEQISGRAAMFGWMADEVAARKRDEDQPVICIMDGEPALWEAIDVFQDDEQRIEILDLLHVTPRLWTAAHLFCDNHHEAAQFVRQRVTKVLQGETDGVIRGLRRMATLRLRGRTRATVETICQYFENNRHRMRYDHYLREGYPIASGVIEGACRHVVKDRMERTGMNWIIPGAKAMLDLRCIYLSGAWDDFVDSRCASETQRLHPHRKMLDALHWQTAA
jgi:hypothetical protein